jgi:hypothetical protein
MSYLSVDAVSSNNQGLLNFRNAFDGGDFTINPFQRGTSQAADITNTTTYGPDRFGFLGGASSAINWSQVADTTVAGFANSLKFQRKSANTDVTILKMGHVFETADCIRLQGQPVTLSFWAASGANYSGGALNVVLDYSTGTNQSLANLFAGSWTGQAHVINSSQVLTSGMVRYQFTATVPATATQLGCILSWTPVGTAGANDYVQLNGFQLEVGNSASVFEHRDVQVELEICQRYFYQINEPASSVIVGVGSNSASNTQLYYLALPVQMRAAPTVTVTVGSFKANSSTAGVVAATGLTGNATHTVNAIGLTSTGTGTAGQSSLLQGGGGAGIIAVSADF